MEMTPQAKQAYNRTYWARWRKANAERLRQYHRDRYHALKRGVQPADIATDPTIDDPWDRLKLALCAYAKHDGDPPETCRRLVNALFPNVAFRL